MTKEQVEALKAAGISESAIIDRILLESDPRTEKPDTEEKKVEQAEKAEPAAEAAAEVKAEPEKETKPEAAEKEDKILAAIEKLTGAVLTHNIRSIGREDEEPDDADKIIGALLRGEPPKTN